MAAVCHGQNDDEGIRNQIGYKVCNEIIYQIPNFNGAAVGGWELINDFIVHFT